MTNNNTNNTNDTTELGPEPRQCTHIKKNGEQCRTRFRDDDASVLKCYAHREKLAEGTAEDKGEEFKVEETALVLRKYVGAQRLQVEGIGTVLVGDNLPAIAVLLNQLLLDKLGVGLSKSAIVEGLVGSKDCLLVIKDDDYQLILTAVAMGECKVVHGGKDVIVSAKPAPKDWLPMKKMPGEICPMCAAEGRVCDFAKKDQMCLQVSWLAMQNGVRHDQVQRDQLVDSRVCIFHGLAGNRAITKAYREAGLIGPDELVYMYGHFERELEYLEKKTSRGSANARAEQEFLAFNKGNDALLKLGDDPKKAEALKRLARKVKPYEGGDRKGDHGHGSRQQGKPNADRRGNDRGQHQGNKSGRGYRHDRDDE